jgi:4-hydroxy-3-methylbut-2-en-1-yl diphosphate reductase
MGQAGETYFQKGFNLRAVVAPALAESYGSGLVERLRELGSSARAGELRLRLAREFGFCYGVERAVEYAYETRERFPGRRLFLIGEIIHNPEVNARLRAMGIRVLEETRDPETRYRELGPSDVVILPAFGVRAEELSVLRQKGCVLVDTTCGSVLNVWKNVHRYARDGFTAVIHGKHRHEETRATASQALTHPGGQYLCLRDREEAELVCAFLRGRLPAAELVERLGHAAGPGFDPARDLERVGLANQTTMLMSESLRVQELLREAMRERFGDEQLAQRFRAFDTICSATQDRQDAVLQLLEGGDLDLMVVIGGFNSSNTIALARLCAERVPTYHISGPECLEGESLCHRPAGGGPERRIPRWLPEGPLVIGLTAGASTPNSMVGAVLEKLLALRGLRGQDLTAG